MSNENADRNIDGMIKKSTQWEVPADVEARLQRRLAEFLASTERRPQNRLRSWAYSFMAWTRIRTAATVASAVLAVIVGFMFFQAKSDGERVYAAAVEKLRNTSSLEYTVVLNETPYMAVDLSYQAPGYKRVHCSWGTEVRENAVTGKKVVFMHLTRMYFLGDDKRNEGFAGAKDPTEQLRSLAQSASETIGEQRDGDKRLLGYRVNKAPDTSSFPGLKRLDIWIDAQTGDADHVDIFVQEEGKPLHRMYIRNIRAGGDIDRSLFDLTPPAGYNPIVLPDETSRASESAMVQNNPQLHADIRQTEAFTAVVLPRKGSYLQIRSALATVEAYLKTIGVTPSGPPFARYLEVGQEPSWEAGYPVAKAVVVQAPFQWSSLSPTLMASAVVKGPWDVVCTRRWREFLQSIDEQGYQGAGPAMELWSGEESQQAMQSIEMRIPVVKIKK